MWMTEKGEKKDVEIGRNMTGRCEWDSLVVCNKVVFTWDCDIGKFSCGGSSSSYRISSFRISLLVFCSAFLFHIFSSPLSLLVVALYLSTISHSFEL